jgi:ankyrin repeat protein
LLARLAIDILAPTSIKNLRQIKKFLADKCLDLSEMYQATYSRIKSSDTTTGDLAQRVVLWICYSQRPLHEAELQHAIATELGDEDFDPDGITPGDLLRSSCMGLVTCDDEGMYSLFHLTAYEFFRSNPDMSSDASHLLISKTCLTYLSFSSTGRQGPCEDLATLEARKAEFRLLDYAAKHSADHIRQVEAVLLEDVTSFLHDGTLRQALMQAFYHRHRDDEDLRRVTFKTLPSGSTPLQVACGQGLRLTAERMLQDGADPKEPDAQGWTPLIAATSYGRLETIQLLISHAENLRVADDPCNERSENRDEDSVAELSCNGESDDGYQDSVYKFSCDGESDDQSEDAVGLNQPDNDGWTPLFWAIIKNQYQAAEQLLSAGASVSVRDGAEWTPIDWAAFRADRAFVDLLLRFTPSASLKGARLQRPLVFHPEEFSPLFLAAAVGDRESIDAMLKFGFDAPTGTEQILERLFKVMGKGDYDWFTERTYRYGRDPTSMPSFIGNDEFSVKVLESAIRLNQRNIVKILVELGAPLGAMKSEARQRTPLHIAACCGHHQICEYLLIRGASPSFRDADGLTAMDLALMIGHPQCTRVFLALSPPPSTLVERGVSFTTFVFGLNDAGSGNLSSSSPTRHKEVSCDPRLPNGALPMLETQSSESRNIRRGNPPPETIPSWFRFEEIVDVLEGLLALGCDLEARDPRRRSQTHLTAIHQACLLVNPDLMSFLISKGANVNQRDRTGESPLHKACSRCETSEETIQTLLQHGADPNGLDDCGRSVLYAASNGATIGVVQCLVANGAVVKAYGDDNYHPLHAACQRPTWHPAVNADTIELIDYILKLSGPDTLSVECRVYGGLPRTPLRLAIGAQNWDAIEHLLKLGATVTDPSYLAWDLWGCAADARGRPFRLLLELGASPTSFFQNKSIIAHYIDDCLRWEKEEGFEDNLVALLEAGADINARSYFSPWGRWDDVTVLHVARAKGMDDDFIQILLRNGAVEDDELEDE